MKVLRMRNDKGKERLYTQFICYPYIMQGELFYFVAAVFYDNEHKENAADTLKVYRKPDEAMAECLMQQQLLLEQTEIDFDTYWELVRNLEDDQNDNESK